MGEKQNISRYCVYTLRDTVKLDEAYDKGGSGSFKENRKWVEGERLFIESQRNKEQMPVLFAAAEKEGGLLYYAMLEAIEVGSDGSKAEYDFTGLTPFREELPKSSLIKKSDNKPLSDNDIRPYRICLTPDL